MNHGQGYSHSRNGIAGNGTAKAKAKASGESAANKALDREFLQLLLLRSKPVTIAEMFEGMNPTWATLTAERLYATGLIDRDEAGRHAINDDGRHWLKLRKG